jgi:formylglycine-generating enzyme required for sulfatase activity
MNFLKSLILLISILIFASPSQLLADQNSKKETAAYYLKKGTAYYNNKQYKEAENAFLRVLQTRVLLHENFYFYYGRVQALNENYEKAESNIGIYLDRTGKQGQYYQKAREILKNVRKELTKKVLKKRPKKNKKNKQPKLTAIPNMIRIGPKSYFMGSNHGDDDQKPTHKIEIKKAFAISQHEITFKQYKLFAKETNRKLPSDSGWGQANHPMINVSFHDALAYCKWLSKKYNRVFRLPTEAEWEYIARSVEKKKKLGFKNLIGIGDANCDDCRFFWEKESTKPVGSYEANSYNLYDVLGNVWEWTCSAYTRSYNGQEKICLASNELDGKTIAVRGGSWKSSKKILKAYVRYNNFPGYKSNDLGFRIVEEL